MNVVLGRSSLIFCSMVACSDSVDCVFQICSTTSRSLTLMLTPLISSPTSIEKQDVSSIPATRDDVKCHHNPLPRVVIKSNTIYIESRRGDA